MSGAVAPTSGGIGPTAPAPAGGRTEPIRDRYDVVIAGARCAGAATAMLLARSGARVLVVDPVPPERDALSTHALMRAGVLQLHRWGLLDAVHGAGTPPVHTTAFHYGDDAIAIPIKPGDGVAALYAPRRTVLDPILVDAAVTAGAHVVHGAAVVDLLRRGGRVTGAVVRTPDRTLAHVTADLVIGADGLHSRVARLVDAPVEVAEEHATATVYGYWPDLHAGEYHWHFAPGASAGAIPTNDGHACVFGAIPAAEFPSRRAAGLESLLRAILERVAPELAARVADRPRRGKLHGFAGVPGFLRRAAGPGWALVGDAGYFKDPATAHGITDALRDAELLAGGFARSGEAGLAEYQATRDELVPGLMRITDEIASFRWSLPELQQLHKALAAEMNRGVELVRSFDTVAPATGMASDPRSAGPVATPVRPAPVP